MVRPSSRFGRKSVRCGSKGLNYQTKKVVNTVFEDERVACLHCTEYWVDTQSLFAGGGCVRFWLFVLCLLCVWPCMAAEITGVHQEQQGNYTKLNIALSEKAISLARVQYKSPTLTVLEFNQPIERKRKDLLPPLSDLEVNGQSLSINAVRPLRLLSAVVTVGTLKLVYDRGADPQVRVNKEMGVPTGQPETTVLIDAGHGGADGGAFANGQAEKAIVLDIARGVADTLAKRPHTRVLMTRNGDYFVSLPDRVRASITNKADVFISIHADSFQDSAATGVGIYMRSDVPSSPEAAALALRENSESNGRTQAVLPPDLLRLLDGALSASQRAQSLNLAHSVKTAMDKRDITLQPDPVRQAAFFVLRQPTAAAVLVETGFLTNRGQAGDLASAAGQARLAAAIAAAVDAYLNTLGK